MNVYYNIILFMVEADKAIHDNLFCAYMDLLLIIKSSLDTLIFS